MMDLGPGTKPEDYLYLDDKWGVRAVPTKGRVFFYVDGPFDGVDDGSINDIMFPWERYAKSPIFMLGDYWGVPDAWKEHTVFKQSCHKDTDCEPFFYAVIFNQEPKPITETKYEISFRGDLQSHPCRLLIPNILRYPDTHVFVTQHYWSYPEDVQSRYRAEYMELLEDSTFVICPRGKGLNSIRFFETLRMGRIPVFISDDAKLPLDGFVDWDEIIVRVPEGEEIMPYVGGWDQDIELASAKARKLSLEYFSDVNKYVDFCAFLNACNCDSEPLSDGQPEPS